MREDTAEGVQIEKEFEDDVVVLHIAGQMRETGAEDLREELDALLADGHFKLIFDLSDVSFVSSTGLGQMMRAYRTAVSNDGFLRIVNPHPLVEEVLHFTKLHTLIGIFPTVEDALEAE